MIFPEPMADEGRDAGLREDAQRGVWLRCSVIVPVYNGTRVIERCLDALAAQTLPPDAFEVIVVDDGSTDNLAEVLAAWSMRHPARPLRLLRQANAGPAAARNHGVREATAPLVLFTDADCAPVPHWAAAFIEAFAGPEVVGAKGAYLTDQTGLVPRFVQAEFEDRDDRERKQHQIDLIATYSAAYRRDVFLENNGFDPIFPTACVEDQEFSFRLAQKGYCMIFVPEAQVKHIHDTNVAEYAERKFTQGFWKALLTRWHPQRMVHDSHTPQVLKVQIVLCALWLVCAAGALASFIWPPLAWSWVALLLVTLVFVGSGLPFLVKLARRSWMLALIGPFMLFVRAAVLGYAYLAGTVHFAGATLGTRQPAISGWKRLIKRGMDVAGALVGLLVALPVVAVAALAIKLDSPGPVFSYQVRIGENGRPFRLIKLRSVAAEDVRHTESVPAGMGLSAPVQTPVNPPELGGRVTRVGRLLQRTSLDDTPQFFNVLIGDMSLVGPRPDEARVVALYEDFHRRRLAVKPGLTGPMQVDGRGNLSLAERIRVELDYIDHYSLLRDCEIILRTFPAIWRGNAAESSL